MDLSFMNWELLTRPPSKTGRYIVAHRGHAEVIHYLDPDQEGWHPSAGLGWQKDPREFGATHYMPLPEVTIEQDAASIKDLKERGLVRVVKADIHTSNVPAFKPTRWQHFKAAFGWKWMPSYRPTTRIITTQPPVNENDPRQWRKV